ncbi:hypothetical protein JCM18382A_03970 [Bradyrhizobium sp. 17-4]
MRAPRCARSRNVVAGGSILVRRGEARRHRDVAPMIISECHNTLRSSFMQKLKADWARVRTDTKIAMKKD